MLLAIQSVSLNFYYVLISDVFMSTSTEVIYKNLLVQWYFRINTALWTACSLSWKIDGTDMTF